MSPIYVLGVGPGGAGFLPPRTRELASACDLLIGGRRNLELFACLSVEKREIGRDMDDLLDFVDAVYRHKKVGILVSGDPGLFSLLATLRRRFPPEVLEVVPAVSALQYLFARLCLPWHDALIFSLHGQPWEALAAELAAVVRQNAKVALFTDYANTPALICELLLQQGIRDRLVHIGENLSYPEEKLYRGSLEECCGLRVGPLNVMVIINEQQ